MQKHKLFDAVLFSVEYGALPYKYRLYFAVKGENGARPSVHRLFVRSKRAFDKFVLGGVYTLELMGIRIKSFSCEDMYPMTDEEYFDLVKLRDRLFLDKSEADHMRVHDKRYDPSKLYYTYSVYKSLLEYKPSFWKAFAINACKLLCYLLAFFIPICLYLLFVYFCATTRTGGVIFGSLALTLPITAVGSLPFLIWLMSIMNTSGMLILLNIPYMRPYMLKRYALRWAGIRKSCYIEPDQQRFIVKSLIITGSILVASIILALVVR